MSRSLPLILWISICIAETAAPAFGLDQQQFKSQLEKIDTLFDKPNIAVNFSNMKKFFPSRLLESSETSGSLPLVDAHPAETYKYGGETRIISDGLTRLETTSLLVLYKGEIVFEDYLKGTAQDDHRIAWSLSKSMLSALFGIAVAEGMITSLDEPVIKYLPQLDESAYKHATIRNVLNMASGVEFNEDYVDPNSDINILAKQLALGASSDDHIASLTEVARLPGIKRSYASVDTQVLAMILREVTGDPVPQYFSQKIWSKIGNGQNFYYLTDNHGVALAWGGVNMRTRDLAKFGQLYLNNGKWNDEQIIPANWVTESTSVSAPPAVNPLDDFQYGYQWWIPPDADQEYFAQGAYGQYIYLNPKANIVIVKTAANRSFHVGGKDENIAIFRAIAEHYSEWKHPK